MFLLDLEMKIHKGICIWSSTKQTELWTKVTICFSSVFLLDLTVYHTAL